MRNSTVLGLFLLVVGGLFLALHPTYTVPTTPVTDDLEATGPVSEQRPYPDWVGPTALVAGLLCLLVHARSSRR